MPMKLYVATHNVHKLCEIGEILPGYEIVADDPDVEETASDFAGNALIKVRAIAARHPGAWSMADDSGLEVRALGGAPGVRSARYAGEPSNTPANNALLLKNLEGVADRTARFTCTIALVDPEGREHVVTGHCPGHIAHAPSGSAGFGYDPLFIPDGHEASFADLGEEAKNKISHRGRALAQVKALLTGRDALPRVRDGIPPELTLADVRTLLRAGNRVLLMTRHAERPHIDHEDPSFGATLPLTADGEEMSRAFGRMLRDFASVVQFASSPLRRTMMTTECIAEGMGVAHPDISPEDALGNGTFYFADQHAVWEEFRDGSFFQKCFACAGGMVPRAFHRAVCHFHHARPLHCRLPRGPQRNLTLHVGELAAVSRFGGDHPRARRLAPLRARPCRPLRPCHRRITAWKKEK